MSEPRDPRARTEPPPPAEQGAWESAVAIGRGMATVFKQTFRPDDTERYPKEIAPIPEPTLAMAASPISCSV